MVYVKDRTVWRNGFSSSMGPKDLWSPVFRMTPRDGKVYMNFSPPFKNAKYHEICLVPPDLFACLKRKNITDPSQEIIFNDVTGNASYEIWVRPHGPNNKALDSWVKSQIFFVPPEPVRMTTMRPEYEKESQPGGTIAMIVVLCIVLAVFVAVVLYLWKKGFLKKMPTCRVPYHQSRKTNDLETRNNQVPVFPIYYPESDIYLNCVETSIDIFCKHGGLDIKPYSETDLRKASQAHTDKWVDVQVKNSVILIFYSHALLRVLLNQTERNSHTYEAICLKALSKINELNNAGAKIVPFVVSFGLETTEEIDLFRKQILSIDVMPLFQLTHKNGSALKSVDFDRLVHKVHKMYSTKHMTTVHRDWEIKARKLLDCIKRLMDCPSYSPERRTMETENDSDSLGEERTPMVKGVGAGAGVVTGKASSGVVRNGGVIQTDLSPKKRHHHSPVKKKKSLSPISITNGYVRFSPHPTGQVEVGANRTVSSGYMSIAPHGNGYTHNLNYSQPDDYGNLNYNSPPMRRDDSYMRPDNTCLSMQADGLPYEIVAPHGEAGGFEMMPHEIDLKHVFFEPEIPGSTDVSMTNLLEGLVQVNQQSC
ncbi:uncharacterized protein LOC121368073 [Gigantopelta aegis]|uniref:uncharacterized protein LOC121368073 n=1 Tax=Gigantopelta aegis TaxID=1735272 RepID=UPI001B88C015|nr:uncharacterized protein LOC121368073 [Gigantopelta aegis]